MSFMTGNKVLVERIKNRSKASHLINYIGKKGEIISWLYMNNQDKENDYKKCKVKFKNNKTAYFWQDELKNLNKIAISN